MCVSTTVVYEYMKSRRNDANNLLDNTHVRIKIHRVFYPRIIHIASGYTHKNARFVSIYINFSGNILKAKYNHLSTLTFVICRRLVS
jgi:hypothetical protein